MPTAVILSGGVTHDFPVLAQRLRELLAECGIEAVTRVDVDEAMTELVEVDLVVVNMLRWRMLEEAYAAQRGTWGISLSAGARAGLSDWIHGGGSMVAMHASSICFDDWPQWRDLCGARWVWNTSNHPPVGPATITVHADGHPITAGLPASFDTDDELYGYLDLADDVDPLLSVERDGMRHPLVWARTVGTGRVVHSTLGHHLPSYVPSVYQRIVRRSALWALGRPDSEVIAT